MLDLSTIINDLLSGKARIVRGDPEIAAATAGNAVAQHLFECPQGVLRLFLGGTLTTVKTTATALALTFYKNRLTTAITFVNGTIGSDVIAIPRDDGSTKDPSWVAAGVPILMEYRDTFYLTHALTAAETITDQFQAYFIEWQVGEERAERLKQKIVFHAPPTM